jgi:hypothetical protein
MHQEKDTKLRIEVTKTVFIRFVEIEVAIPSTAQNRWMGIYKRDRKKIKSPNRLNE